MDIIFLICAIIGVAVILALAFLVKKGRINIGKPVLVHIANIILPTLLLILPFIISYSFYSLFEKNLRKSALPILVIYMEFLVVAFWSIIYSNIWPHAELTKKVSDKKILLLKGAKRLYLYYLSAFISFIIILILYISITSFTYLAFIMFPVAPVIFTPCFLVFILIMISTLIIMSINSAIRFLIVLDRLHTDGFKYILLMFIPIKNIIVLRDLSRQSESRY